MTDKELMSKSKEFKVLFIVYREKMINFAGHYDTIITNETIWIY